MSTQPLKRLTIQCLRGAVGPFSISFDKNRPLTVVYGENASGKSTICDAFEFLGAGTVGSLDKRGLGKTARFWPSLGKEAGEVSVSLEMANGSCGGTLVKGEVQISEPKNRPVVEVLRRAQILDLITSTAADRYQVVSPFIDVSEVEASESSLRELIRTLSKSREVAIARVQENRDAIRQFWEAAGRQGPEPMRWAESEIARDEATLEMEIARLERLRASYQRLVEDVPRYLQAGRESQVAKDGLATAEGAITSLLERAPDDAGDLIGLLEAAKAHLSRHQSLEKCPLCESAENVSNLAARVEARLGSMQELRRAEGLRKGARETTVRADQKMALVEANCAEHAAVFRGMLESDAWPVDVHLPSSALPTSPGEWEGWLPETAMLSEEWKEAERSRQDKKQFRAALQKAIKTNTENTQAQKELDNILPRLSRTLEILEEERRRLVDQILGAIATEVGRLYEAVHPVEGLDKITLGLDPRRRASLDIGASFQGVTGAPPQAYFSESHLDTLGLCIFLALAGLEGAAGKILVLDDVLASVDEPHVERLINMLYDEVARFRHCIITTHYRPWKEKLRWGWLQNGQCQFVELGQWTASGGVKQIGSLSDLERLSQLLAEDPPDPQLICAKAGVVLEAALDFLTLLYACPVPRKPGGTYTLGDLLPAVGGKLRAALKVEVRGDVEEGTPPSYVTHALAPYLEELNRIAQARNVFGCHFNALSFALLEADAIGFGKQVYEFMMVLTDQEAGWPRNDKSGSYWATSGETRRLHPLKRPG